MADPLRPLPPDFDPFGPEDEPGPPPASSEAAQNEESLPPILLPGEEDSHASQPKNFNIVSGSKQEWLRENSLPPYSDDEL